MGRGDGEWNGRALCARYERLFDDADDAVGGPALCEEPWIGDEDGAVFVDVIEFIKDPEPVGGRYAVSRPEGNVLKSLKCFSAHWTFRLAGSSDALMQLDSPT